MDASWVNYLDFAESVHGMLPNHAGVKYLLHISNAYLRQFSKVWEYSGIDETFCDLSTGVSSSLLSPHYFCL